MLKQSQEPDLPVPDDREYATDEAAELDAALVTAIEKAEAADNEYLAQVLRNELGSHYYGSKLAE
jgi:hypothetical protein